MVTSLEVPLSSGSGFSAFTATFHFTIEGLGLWRIRVEHKSGKNRNGRRAFKFLLVTRQVRLTCGNVWGSTTFRLGRRLLTVDDRLENVKALDCLF
jgi:hypothetical protein